jgi:phospholipase/carboxylesterase
MAGLTFDHVYAPGGDTPSARPPLLLLHGTGGDERDLMPLGREVAPGTALLSPRGKVLENGMPRFFRRLAEGVFDEDDVRARAHELADFVQAACAYYRITTPVALGYSNGANIAAAMMLLRPEALAGGILLRAMPPLRSPEPRGGLAHKRVLIVSGKRDPIAAPANAARLKVMLEGAGATVDHEVMAGGHELSRADIVLASRWLEANEMALSAVSV